MDKPEWYLDTDNIALTANYMAQTYPVRRESMEQIAYMVEKPWKHEDIYLAALAYNEEMEKAPLAS